jgi:hypothetical protein
MPEWIDADIKRRRTPDAVLERYRKRLRRRADGVAVVGPGDLTLPFDPTLSFGRMAGTAEPTEIRANDNMWETVLAAHQIDLSQIDPSHGQVDAWIGLLADAEKSLRELRLRLEGLKTGRSCVECDHPMSGRSDRRFCGWTCRQRAHRRQGSGTDHLP